MENNEKNCLSCEKENCNGCEVFSALSEIRGVELKFRPKDKVWVLRLMNTTWVVERNSQIINLARIKVFSTHPCVVYVMNSGAEFEESEVFLNFMEAYNEVDKRNENGRD